MEVLRDVGLRLSKVLLGDMDLALHSERDGRLHGNPHLVGRWGGHKLGCFGGAVAGVPTENAAYPAVEVADEGIAISGTGVHEPHSMNGIEQLLELGGLQ